MFQSNPEKKNSNKIRIVTNLLTQAIKLYLKSQVTHVEQLEVDIQASDGQLLTGSIPWISVFASDAIYQGIHVTKVKLVAENIRVNVGGVIKGQPLRLLEIVPVAGELSLTETALSASLNSKLLTDALNDALLKLLPESSQNSKSISFSKITLNHGQATLNGTLTSDNNTTPISICLGLELLSGTELRLTHIPTGESVNKLTQGQKSYDYALGSDVDIQEFSLFPKELFCRGRANINP